STQERGTRAPANPRPPPSSVSGCPQALRVRQEFTGQACPLPHIRCVLGYRVVYGIWRQEQTTDLSLHIAVGIDRLWAPKHKIRLAKRVRRGPEIAAFFPHHPYPYRLRKPTVEQ